jgi:hypothetical protein
MSDVYYVYEHRRNDTGAVFYVGKGRARRDAARNNRSAHWNSIVNKAGGYQICRIATDIDEELSHLVEVEAIDKYRRIGLRLANKTDGGEGSTGAKLSEQTRRRMSESRRGANNPNFGKARPESVKKVISEKRKGRVAGKDHPRFGMTVSDEMRKRISEKLKGSRLTPEQAAKHSEALRRYHDTAGRRKPVLCVTTGEWFPTASAAADKLKLIRQSIRDVCKGKLKQTGGYVFEWSKQ